MPRFAAVAALVTCCSSFVGDAIHTPAHEDVAGRGLQIRSAGAFQRRSASAAGRVVVDGESQLLMAAPRRAGSSASSRRNNRAESDEAVEMHAASLAELQSTVAMMQEPSSLEAEAGIDASTTPTEDLPQAEPVPTTYEDLLQPLSGEQPRLPPQYGDSNGNGPAEQLLQPIISDSQQHTVNIVPPPNSVTAVVHHETHFQQAPAAVDYPSMHSEPSAQQMLTVASEVVARNLVDKVDLAIALQAEKRRALSNIDKDISRVQLNLDTLETARKLTVQQLVQAEENVQATQKDLRKHLDKQAAQDRIHAQGVVN